MTINRVSKSCGLLIEHGASGPQVRGREAFGETVMNRCQNLSHFLAAVLGFPQAREAHGQPEFPEQCVLLAGHFRPSIEAIFDPRVIRVAQRDQLAFNPKRFRYEPSVTRIRRETQRGVDLGETIIDAAKRPRAVASSTKANG
jgi:hypothetical protein